MRAAVIEDLGGEPMIRQLPTPEPTAEEHLVAVATAALNPHDLVLAAGIGLKPRLPYVPGVEGVGRLSDGSRVYIPGARHPHGTFAEYCVADNVVPVPDDITDAQALGVGVAGTTAWLALTWKANLQAGESVLITGATGAVGQVAVQAAVALGASKVVAAGRDQDTLARLRDLGATDVIELTGDYPSALRAAAGDGFDVVVDSLFGEPLMAAITATRVGGRIVNLGMRAGRTMELSGIALKGKDLFSIRTTDAPAAEFSAAYTRLIELARQGRIVTHHSTLPLENVSEAWRQQPTSPHSKLLLTI